MRSTPENISEIGENEVFVFGSNLNGHHYGGAAKLAHEKFGAVTFRNQMDWDVPDYL